MKITQSIFSNVSNIVLLFILGLGKKWTRRLSNSAHYNENTPLGWSESLFVLALYHLGEKKVQKKKK
jgi:hypothetical protein